MADELLTVDEVAQRLRLVPQTVRNMIDRGDLPAVRIGARRVRVREGDLEAFIDAGATAAARDEIPEDQLRAEFADSLADARARLEGGDDGELAAALRAVSRASSRLARALERRSPG